MNKILVIVEVPSIMEQYEVYISKSVTIKALIDMLIEAVTDLSKKNYTTSGSEVICLKERNIILNSDCKVEQYNIENGDCLVLI